MVVSTPYSKISKISVQVCAHALSSRGWIYLVFAFNLGFLILTHASPHGKVAATAPKLNSPTGQFNIGRGYM